MRYSKLRWIMISVSDALRKFWSLVLEIYEPKGSEFLWREVQKRTTRECVDFVYEFMGDATYIRTPKQLLKYAMQVRRNSGLIAEFGVYKGDSINFIAKLAGGQEVHGFDSFRGLPESWGGFFGGANVFDNAGRPPRVRKNVRLHVGWFDQTVPKFFEEHTEPVSLMHIDSDIYSSARIVLDNTKHLLKCGSIIVFDEFFNYPGFKKHEFRAFNEFVTENNVAFNYLAYSGQQVAVEITEIKLGSGPSLGRGNTGK